MGQSTAYMATYSDFRLVAKVTLTEVCHSNKINTLIPQPYLSSLLRNPARR